MVIIHIQAERRSWMEAIRKKQEPRMKACLAYGMLPLDPDVALELSQTQDQHLYDDISALNDDASYEQISDQPRYVCPQSPKSPPLPPKPTPTGETDPVAHNGDDVASATLYYNLPPYGTQTRPAPEVSPTPRRKPAATTQEEEDPEYEEAVAMLDRKASFLNASQLKQLIGMLQSAQGSLAKEGETKDPNNGSKVHKGAGEIPPPPLTPPPPLEMQDIDVDLYPEVLEPECSHNNPEIYDTIPDMALTKSPTTKCQKPPPPPKPGFGKKSPIKPPIQTKPQSHQVSKQNLSKFLNHCIPKYLSLKPTNNQENETLIFRLPYSNLLQNVHQHSNTVNTSC